MKFPQLLRYAIPALLVLTAAACQPAPSGTPTTDPVLLEFAIQTAHANLTAEALANPSATPTPPPTNTPLPPTNTPEPTFTLAPAITATPAGTLTPTRAQGAAVEFVYAATYPENKRIFLPNENFGLALGFQNVGTVSLSGCMIKLVNFSGEDTVDDQASSSKVVAPGEKVEFNLAAFGSELLGPHTWVFQMYCSPGAIPGGVGVFNYTSE